MQVILFDLAENSFSTVAAEGVIGEGLMFASPELAATLNNPSFAGAEAGRFHVSAVTGVPEPSSVFLIGCVGVFAVLTRRRNKI